MTRSPGFGGRGPRLVALAAGLALAGGARAAHSQQACVEPSDAAANPLAGGTSTLTPADFGTVPEVCPAGEASLRLRGELVYAAGAPDFFGRIAGTATLRTRLRVTAHTWLALSIDLVDERYVDDAGLAAHNASFGPATVGFHWTALDRARAALAIYARALLPIDTARGAGIEAGLEVGASARVPLPRRFSLDGGVAVAAPADLTAGQWHSRVRPAALAEAWWSRSPSLGLFAGLEATVELAPAPDLVWLAPRVGLRKGLRHRLWLAFLAEAPVAGSDRTTLSASAFLGWTP